MKLTKNKLKEIIREELEKGRIDETYYRKFSNYLETLDQLGQDLKIWALKAIPHRKKDINDSLKLYKLLYKKVQSLIKDVIDY